MSRDLADLRNTVASLDDYKPAGQAVVNFRFNSDKLYDDAKQQLDRMAARQRQYKRFFLAVEGFTDSTGSADYNNALSRRRADAVVKYLVAKHNIPIYRIQMVGLGMDKPQDDGRNNAACAKNRVWNFRTTTPFLASTMLLFPVRCARDFICSISSFSGSRATL